MIKPAALILALAAVAGCTTTKEAKVAVCDGKHRRPANLYGSVLPDAPLETPGGAAAPPMTAAPPAKAGAPPTGAAAGQTPSPEALSTLDPASTLPCGRSA